MSEQAQQNNVQVEFFDWNLSVQDKANLQTVLVNTEILTAKYANQLIMRMDNAYKEAVKKLQEQQLPPNE